ncbi:MAG: inorganic phosphate transporter [Eggerthellaceae bacterium]
MSIEWVDFFNALVSNPTLVAVVILNIGVIIVNGATDAPNAIATVVSTRCIKPGRAVIMAAICNFFGLLIITLVSSAVATTIFRMVDFGQDQHAALMALLAAMVAIIVWGVTAWFFGIPTSQSHSLIAGLTGAALAVHGGFDGVNWAEWMKVIYGIVLSAVMGFGFGWLFARIIKRTCKNIHRVKLDTFFTRAQIVAAAAVAFVHGAQDGQKFMSIFMLAIALSIGAGNVEQFDLPIWLMVICALNMGIGTASGGKRIIKNVGVDMVKLEKFQGFASSMSTAVSLLISTLGGLPVSTTHTSTTAIMGVGAEKNIRDVKWSIAWDMAKTWILTFPGCGLLGYVFTLIFLAF